MRIPYDSTTRFPIPKFRLPEIPPEPKNLKTRALSSAVTESRETPMGLKLRPLHEYPLRQTYSHDTTVSSGYDPTEVPIPDSSRPRFPAPFGQDRNNRTEFYHERRVGTVVQNPTLPWVERNPEAAVSTRPSEDIAEAFRNSAIDQPASNPKAISIKPVHDAIASTPSAPDPGGESSRPPRVKFF